MLTSSKMVLFLEKLNYNTMKHQTFAQKIKNGLLNGLLSIKQKTQANYIKKQAAKSNSVNFLSVHMGDFNMENAPIQYEAPRSTYNEDWRPFRERK